MIPLKFNDKTLIDLGINTAGKILFRLYHRLGWRPFTTTGRFIGILVYILNRPKRTRVIQEVRYLLGNRLTPKHFRTITKRSFENYYKRQVETLFFGTLSPLIIENTVQAEGLDNLDQALSRGRGVILLLAHFGSFLLPLPFLGFRGYRIHQLTGRQRNTSRLSESLWKWRQKEADRLPVGYLQADRFLRPVYKALKNNEIITIAFDGRDGSTLKETRLLDRHIAVSPGPMNLAARTCAAIVPAFVVRQADDTHKIFFHKALNLSPTENKEPADTLIQKFSDLFGQYIAAFPCHYGMILQIMKAESNSGEAKPFFITEKTRD